MNFSWSLKFRIINLRCMLGLVLLSVCGASQSENRFQFIDDGREVLDTRTQLIWRRCPEGMIWQADQCQGETTYWMWYEALPLATQAAKTTGKLWRVPNVKELYSIVDLAKPEMAIDLQVFPSTPNSQFWTSTHYAQDAFFGWVVHFWYGSVYFSYLEDLSAVRLVRDAPE